MRGEFAVNSYDGKVYILKDQTSVGIATTTVTVNPWEEPNGVGAGVSYNSDVNVLGVVTATSFVGDGSGLTGISGLSTFSGNYNHLYNTPTIPTNNNQLTNGAGYITGYTVVEQDVTSHQAALSITESQISDLGTYATAASVAALNSTVAGIDTSGFITADDVGIATGSTRVLVDESEDDNNFYNILFTDVTPGAGNQYHTLQVDNAGLRFNPSTNVFDVQNIEAYGVVYSNAFYDYNNAGTSYNFDSNGDAGILTNGTPNLVVGVDGNTRVTNSLNVSGITTSNGVDVTGNITVSGTVDGVDVATLNSTVAGIDTSGFITDYTVTESDVTGHQAALSITESQISDLGTYLTSSDLSSYATTSYVDTEVAGLVDSAPGTLNTLNELAAALGDDANFSTTVTNSIATKLPLAGGTMTGNIDFGDNVRLNIGSGDDFTIRHNGTDTILENDTGHVYFYNYANDKDVILRTDNGSGGVVDYVRCDGSNGRVRLYHYGTEKAYTKSDGFDVVGELQCDSLDVDGAADITGNVAVTGNITVSGTVDGVDVAALSSTVAGIDTSGFITSVASDADTLDGIQASSFLRSDANDTFTGTITGNTLLMGGSQIVSSAAKLQVNGFQRTGTIYLHEGTTPSTNNRSLRNNAGSLEWESSTVWTADNDGSGSGLDADTVDGIQASSFLRSDAADSFSGALTGSGTISVTGTKIECGRTSGSVAMTTNDGGGNANICFNHTSKTPDVSGSACRIEASVDSNTGSMTFEVGNSVTSGTSVNLSSIMKLTTSDITAYKSILPNSNNSRDLGSSSLRFRNVYTNDLNLSNEGGANDVDGTWGDWTMQEGENDMFMINNRTGNKFRIKLEPVE